MRIQLVALFSCQFSHLVKRKYFQLPMAYQYPEGMSRVKLSYRSLIVLNDISSWAIVMNFWLLNMNCVSWLATKYKPTFMCLSVRQYQFIYFVIVRLDDIQDVVCNRIVRIDDWHTHHNAIFIYFFYKFTAAMNHWTIHHIRKAYFHSVTLLNSNNFLYTWTPDND